MQKREVKSNNAARRLQSRFRARAACEQRREQSAMSCMLQAALRRLWLHQRVSLLTGILDAQELPACLHTKNAWLRAGVCVGAFS